MQELLSVSHLFARYGAGFALEDISFSVRTGTVAVVLGANGSGKTTLLRAVCQQMKHQGVCRLSISEKLPNESETTLVTMEQLSVRQLAGLVSYIPQRSGISIGIAVLDVVLMGFNPSLGLLERPNDTKRQQAREALAVFGIESLADRDFLTLSEGQKQLVMLARTLVERSGLLVLDEPDSALDFSNRYGIMQRLCSMVKGKQKAAILSLHDPVLALQFADHLILIREGCLVGQLYPNRDSVALMEDALRQIYGPVSLLTCEGRNKEPRRILVWEKEE